jgi:hypothetical protein
MMLMVDISGSESFGSKTIQERHCYWKLPRQWLFQPQKNDKMD